ncbi:MAG: VOC family protein [Thiomicrospira sp.]
MFSALGVRYVDHVAVTTKDLMPTLADYLSLPGARLINGPGQNRAQDVLFAFVDLGAGGVVEVLAPLSEQSPIYSHLAQGGGTYHVCYAVENLAQAITTATQDFGARLVKPAQADDAFYGRQVAFLFHPNHGLFELVEAWPNGVSISRPANSIQSSPSTLEASVRGDDTTQALLEVFNRVMQTDYATGDALTMDTVAVWDSLKHLLLIMEVERVFELRIPADELSRLVSFNQLLTYVRQGQKEA